MNKLQHVKWCMKQTKLTSEVFCPTDSCPTQLVEHQSDDPEVLVSIPTGGNFWQFFFALSCVKIGQIIWQKCLSWKTQLCCVLSSNKPTTIVKESVLYYTQHSSTCSCVLVPSPGKGLGLETKGYPLPSWADTDVLKHYLPQPSDAGGKDCRHFQLRGKSDKLEKTGFWWLVSNHKKFTIFKFMSSITILKNHI